MCAQRCTRTKTVRRQRWLVSIPCRNNAWIDATFQAGSRRLTPEGGTAAVVAEFIPRLPASHTPRRVGGGGLSFGPLLGGSPPSVLVRGEAMPTRAEMTTRLRRIVAWR